MRHSGGESGGHSSTQTLSSFTQTLSSLPQTLSSFTQSLSRTRNAAPPETGSAAQRGTQTYSDASSSFSATAATKPAASAASVEVNQTSAMVLPYHGDSVVWYFIESALPLMS